MRLKSDSVDYHYFRDPNIIQIDITHLIKNAQETMLPLPKVIENKLLEDNIPSNLIEQLLDNYDAYKVFEYVNKQINNASLVAVWIMVELGALLKTTNNSYNMIEKPFLDKCVTLLKLLSNQEINGKQAKTIFSKMYETNKEPALLIKELGFVQIKDTNVIQEYLVKYLKENPTMVEQYQTRPERVEKFFIGLLMRDTKGQANPNIANEVLKKILSQ
jgi:aspartyl-tRNA(Asn)/glutamyl-tRNA(Gln) amidotransferase subunit B